MRLAVFTYDFPHRKSFDFLVKLWLERTDIVCVLAAPRKSLGNSAGRLRVKPRHLPVPEAHIVCKRMALPYLSVDHRSPEVVRVLQERSVDLGVIAGARILPPDVIAAPSIGIVNFHPGLIPEVRGLDALKWTVYMNAAPGVTAHLIDERVDAGRIVAKQHVPVYHDDTWVDVSLRLEETQVTLLPEVLRQIRQNPDPASYPAVGPGDARSRMSEEIEKEVAAIFPVWRSSHAELRDDR